MVVLTKRNFICSNCKKTVECLGLPGQKKLILCPHCSTQGYVTFSSPANQPILNDEKDEMGIYNRIKQNSQQPVDDSFDHSQLNDSLISKSFSCPECKTIIECQADPGKRFEVFCPSCDSQGFINMPEFSKMIPDPERFVEKKYKAQTTRPIKHSLLIDSEEEILEELHKKIELETLVEHHKIKGAPQPPGLSDRARWLIWPFLQRSSHGKTVFFEDTGEKIGMIQNVLTDDNKNPVGYEIKEEGSDATFQFPVENFRQTEQGLVFTPMWFSQANQLVKELEFRWKSLPELEDILLAGAVSKDKIYGILTRTHPELRKIFDQGILMRKTLLDRLEDLHIEYVSIRKNMTRVSEKRLLKQISRRDFAQEIIEARRQARILEINIKRCKTLIQRLDALPFITKYREILKIMPSFKDIVDELSTHVLATDAKGYIIEANQHFLKAFGYATYQVIGKQTQEFMPSKDSALFQKVNKHIIQDEQSRSIEVTFNTCNGKEKHMIGKGFVVSGAFEGESRVVWSFQEISESQESKRDIIREISHEFINPLCISKGYIHLMLEGKSGNLTQDQKENLEHLKNNVLRIEDLLQKTLQTINKENVNGGVIYSKKNSTHRR
jgi:PAS domain S-box-containing protein